MSAYWGLEHFCGGKARRYPVLHWADEPEDRPGPRTHLVCEACGEMMPLPDPIRVKVPKPDPAGEWWSLR